MFREYKEEYIKQENPICIKCGKAAEGDIFDGRL